MGMSTAGLRPVEGAGPMLRAGLCEHRCPQGPGNVAASSREGRGVRLQMYANVSLKNEGHFRVIKW